MKKSALALITTGLMALTLHAQAVKESDLPQAEQDHLKAARNAAYKADPAVKQLGVDAKKARRDAMIKADPSVAPILDQCMPLSGPAAVKSADLPPADKAKYDAAKKAADKANPAIKEQEAAAKKAVYAAAVKTDPTVAPIVKKLTSSN
ncbi:MAG: hypothetical protein WCP41_05805 [Verrucomicrobiota bacterium]